MGIACQFPAKAGHYEGRWFDEGFRKKDKESDPDLRPERIWSKELAEEIQKKCLNQSGTVTEEKRPSKQLSPLLYDLTSLQREANSRFGLPAGRTLQLAQALYERHKMLTYPRTDSRALPEDYLGTVKGNIEGIYRFQLRELSLKELRETAGSNPTSAFSIMPRYQITLPIIPTSLGPKKKLNDDEQKIYDMVVRRFLAVFFPSRRISNHNAHHPSDGGGL